jgi:glycosyltransferase involved in cell wall biosynthesis
MDKSEDGSDMQAARLPISDSRFTVLPPETDRAYHLKNLTRAIAVASGDVIICLDCDDRLLDVEALDKIAKVYEDKKVWLTYGSYQSSDNRHNHWNGVLAPEDWQNIRGSEWKTSHLRTFRKSLYERINHYDFLDMNGDWLQRATDRALMYPLLEMAGPEHTRYIEDKLIWITAHHDKSLIDYEERAIEHIKQRPAYTRITE